MSGKTDDANERPLGQDPPELRLGNLVRRIWRLLHRSLAQRLVEHGLSNNEFLILRELRSVDGLTQREIAGTIGISAASAVTVIDSLQQRGLVKRVPNVADRRKINIHLTHDGKRSISVINQVGITIGDIAMSDLGPHSKDQALDMLRRIIGALEHDQEIGDADAI